MAHREPPEEVAIVAVSGVLRGYRDEAREQLPAVFDGSVEGLHDFRVAMRRARSVLAVSGGVLNEEHRMAAAHSLRSMARLSSPVRDLDVFIEELPGLCEATGRGDEQAVAALVELARASRERPSVRLEWALRGPDGRRMFQDWDLVSTPVPPGGEAPGPRATEPALPVVDSWTMDAFKRTRRRGRAALASDDLEHWHDLRKALKRLRYLVTAFADMHRRSELKPVRKHLRRLQEHIGLLQDHRVQGELADDLRRRAEAARLDPAAGLAADLGSHLERELERTHAECTEAWLSFDVPDTKKAFKALTAARSSG